MPYNQNKNYSQNKNWKALLICSAGFLIVVRPSWVLLIWRRYWICSAGECDRCPALLSVANRKCALNLNGALTGRAIVAGGIKIYTQLAVIGVRLCWALLIGRRHWICSAGVCNHCPALLSFLIGRRLN